MPRPFQLRDFIDQDTVRRSSDLQHVHTERVQSLPVRLNDLTVVPPLTNLGERE